MQVAVEFKKGKLLIPSHLPEIKPDLPKFYAPENTVSQFENVNYDITHFCFYYLMCQVI